MAVSTRRVTRTYQANGAPALVGEEGYFQLVAQFSDGGTITVAAEPVHFTINALGEIVGPDGDVGVVLECNDDDSTTPTGTSYIVAEPHRSQWSLVVSTTDPSTVDLATKAPAVVGTPVFSYIPTSAKGAANGVATLDGTGNVPLDQLANASGGGGSVTITSPDSSITVAGTSSNPTLEVVAARYDAAGAAATALSTAETFATSAAATAQSTAESFATSAVATETTRAEAAEALKAPLASPALTGTPTAPNASALTNTTQLATTAYADAAVAVETSRATTAEGLKAPLASPALTGTPTAPTKTALTNNTDIATTAYADAAVAVEASRATTAEALLAPKASPPLTGTPTAPTASALTNTTQLATTAYADAAVGVETSRATTAEGLKAPLASPALTGTPTAPTKTALTNNTDIATTAYADAAVAVENSRATTAEALALPKTGGTMSGPIAMGSSKVTGIANGTVSTDAAAFGQIPTAYVSSNVAGQGVAVSGATGAVTVSLSGTEAVSVVATSGTTQTLAAVATDIGNDITLSASCTVTMPTAARGAFCYVIARQAASGGPFTITFTGVKWPNGAAPTMSTGASNVDRFDFVSDGTSWYGTTSGQKFS